jgi:hypothetical protein
MSPVNSWWALFLFIRVEAMMAVYLTHCRVSRCCVVASDFVMYTLDRLCCLILIKKVVCIILMQRLGLPHFKKKGEDDW